MINNGWEETNADHHIRSLNIKTPGAEQLIMNLSGGNQQKAILGRWLSEEMKVILLDEPTRGIDVGAKHEIYNVIYASQRAVWPYCLLPVTCQKCSVSPTVLW